MEPTDPPGLSRGLGHRAKRQDNKQKANNGSELDAAESHRLPVGPVFGAFAPTETLADVLICRERLTGLPNDRVDRPRRANASQRTGRTRCSTPRCVRNGGQPPARDAARWTDVGPAP